ncbi:NAD(P)-dependent oxidoreductase [Oceanomicrobium pacificus]|uniref:Dehydrogenase n=1 Tax=Oceanomicrobium pacificus TaxID=2692916 RepID=A0A6B0TZJ5_9RHOB|nr:hydroxyacid dehydrogenase [Oceanomicrobium pacificus]MXU64321.1 dehydrogenase [Oceanomicrobium pacificus]
MGERPVIFSTHLLHPQVTAALEEIGRYRVAERPTPEAIARDSAGAQYIVVRAPIAPEIIARETGLRALVRHGAGLDMIPVDAATEAGIVVANVPGANAVTVAEHAIWSALALLRRYPQVHAGLRRDGWEAARRHSDAGRELAGRTIGIVGMGNIGRELARIAGQGFGMQVLSHTRSPDKVPDGVTACSLPDLLAASDVLVLACPLNDATRGLIGAAELAAMRPGSVLVNVSRGPVVVEEALLSALDSGHLAGAALDVFDRQPLPPDHPLLDRDTVILTPHMAGITEESMLRMGQGVVAEIRRLEAGERPDNLVNPDVWPRYAARRDVPKAQP